MDSHTRDNDQLAVIRQEITEQRGQLIEQRARVRRLELISELLALLIGGLFVGQIVSVWTICF